ncbi:hypothetical protein SAM19_00133 [Brevibacillus laterosporus]|nr:hypothetical protein [Brevibacillus laterosporus]
MFGGMLVVGLFIYSKNELGVLGQLVQLQTTMVFIFLEFGRIIASLQHSLSGSARVYGLLNHPVEEIDPIIVDNKSQQPMLTNLLWGCLMDTKPSLEGIRYVYQEDNGKESPLHVLYYQKLLSFYLMSLRLL